MEKFKTTPSQENYIEHIYRMLKKGPLFPSALAKELGVTRPSASKFIKSLVNEGLVSHPPHGAIKLTANGKRIGEAIVRRKKCIYKLLVEICDMDPDEAMPEIHRLEHFISDDVLTRFETLTEFAGSSKGWVKRLHHRIEKRVNAAPPQENYIAGASQIHKNPADKT